MAVERQILISEKMNSLAKVIESNYSTDAPLSSWVVRSLTPGIIATDEIYPDIIRKSVDSLIDVIDIPPDHTSNSFGDLHTASELVRRFDDGTLLPSPPQGLTSRQYDVLLCFAEGKTHKEVGIILGMKYRTVTRHTHNILDKFPEENLTSLVAKIAKGEF